MTDPAGSPSAHTNKFSDVLKREYADLWLRRPEHLRNEAGEAAETGDRPPSALYGVALSGGGIRSASFCLGALQALDQQGLAERIDYLSTVSGGGYTGASMISAMRQNGERFPFSPGKASDIHDNEPVNNLRDNSRFLAPRGSYDLLISLAVILRGLVVNFILVLALVLPLATIMILANPTKAHLERSIVDDLAKHWIPASYQATETYKSILPYLSDQFLMSKTLLGVLMLLLLGWAMQRSFAEARGAQRDRPVPEQDSRFAIWGRHLIISLAVALFLEMQPPILLWALNALQSYTLSLSDMTGRATVAGVVGTIAAAIVTLTATFRSTLVGWITKALNSPTLGAWLKALLARSIIYTAGVVLPLVIYLFFLLVTLWGIEPLSCTADLAEQTMQARLHACLLHTYPITPQIFAVTSTQVLVMLVYLVAAMFLSVVTISSLAFDLVDCIVALVVGALAAAVLLALSAGVTGDIGATGSTGFAGVVAFSFAVVVLGRFILLALAPADSRQGWSTRLSAFLVKGWGWTLICLFVLAFLALSAIATRAGPGEYAVEWTVLARYVASTLLIWLVGWQFTENANGLHRLYRDRLSAAFRLSQPENVPLRLSDLDDSSPYLLVNATLNAREGDRGPDANPTSDPEADRTTDPAKRGRNAEFFMFSRFFVGSASTGYVDTKALEAVDGQLDLATAVAISGAAVSSSMGRVNIGLLGPTLALLNLRLGYWLTNPRAFDPKSSVAGADDSSPRSWHDTLRLYLFAEAFGRLRADSSRVYVTDGGHIDNIGLYQLLKRRCRFIVVIDSEADPAMTFGAFSDLQRFARIDEGVRVTLDWMPIRDATLARMADKTKRVAAASHDNHFAVGKILYEREGGESEEGLLIYVKASVTGDEPDYVLDYERRYPQFPHESTGDQFFSEEQMEAYRVLGYHCVARFLAAERKDVPGSAEDDQGKSGQITRMLRDLRMTAPTTKLLTPRPMPPR